MGIHPAENKQLFYGWFKAVFVVNLATTATGSSYDLGRMYADGDC